MSTATYAGPGAVLREARLTSGLAPWQVARKAEISPGHLSCVERGTEPLTPATARKVAAVFGIEAVDLGLSAWRVPPSAAVTGRALLTVKTFRDIPRTCPCDREMVFARRRVDGWGFVGPNRERPWCPHHSKPAVKR